MNHRGSTGRGWLREARAPLVESFDVALLDLDGTVYVGAQVMPSAPSVLLELRQAGVRPAFVTNNASRPPQAVAEHLSALGVACDVAEVVTAAQAGAALIAARVPAGSHVLVVGGAGVRDALLEVGLTPVGRADEGPVALLQGWAPDLGWSHLAEGAFALADGLPWIVTNTDFTLPTDRGIAPGNGSFVALLAEVSGRSPDAVAGKPQPPLLEQAVEKLSARNPIVVGDRLDTDIEGAAAVGLPSLLVLSGVTDVRAVLTARPEHRPTYLAADLAGLLRSHPSPVRDSSGAWSCGNWTARLISAADPAGGGQTLRLAVFRGETEAPPQDGADPLRAAAAAMWAAADEGIEVSIDEEVLATVAVAMDTGPAGPAGSGEQGA